MCTHAANKASTAKRLPLLRVPSSIQAFETNLMYTYALNVGNYQVSVSRVPHYPDSEHRDPTPKMGNYQVGVLGYPN